MGANGSRRITTATLAERLDGLKDLMSHRLDENEQRMERAVERVCRHTEALESRITKLERARNIAAGGVVVVGAIVAWAADLVRAVMMMFRGQ